MTNSGAYLTREPPAFKRGANEELEGGPTGPTDPGSRLTRTSNPNPRSASHSHSHSLPLRGEESGENMAEQVINPLFSVVSQRLVSEKVE
jgi:hypothetical protein